MPPTADLSAPCLLPCDMDDPARDPCLGCALAWWLPEPEEESGEGAMASNEQKAVA